MIAANFRLESFALSPSCDSAGSSNKYSWRAQSYRYIVGFIAVIATTSCFSLYAASDVPSIEVEEMLLDDAPAIPGDIRSLDEVWEISTRHLPQSACAANFDQLPFRVSRWLPSSGWIASSLEQYLASVQGQASSSMDNKNADMPLHNIVYVHGNWMPADLTRDRGLLIYRHLAQRAQNPIRVTVFSWASQREKPILRDVRENAIVAELQGLYLGALLQRFPGEQPLGVIGFSYGARAVTGSMHALAGGILCGRTLNEGESPKEIRISLMAAAIDRNWLLPNSRHGKAAESISSIVNLYNSNDPVLQRYHLIGAEHHAIAAGVAGLILPRSRQGNENARSHSVSAPDYVKLRQFDCRPALGRSHDERSYYRDCSCTKFLLDHVLWNDWIDSNVALDIQPENEPNL